MANVIQQQGPRSRGRSLRDDVRGAVFVEFLIAFLPVFVFFLCVIQLGLLFSVRLVTEHAAVNGVRALAVVGGDEPKRYGRERPNQLPHAGERQKAVRQAVILTLAPLILNGVIQTVDVIYPKPDDPLGIGQSGTLSPTPIAEKKVSKVRLRVEAKAACRLALSGPIVCRTMMGFLDPTQSFNLFLPTVTVRAEAIFPYQGARYDYP